MLKIISIAQAFTKARKSDMSYTFNSKGSQLLTLNLNNFCFFIVLFNQLSVLPKTIHD